MRTKLITIDATGSVEALREVATALVRGALVGMPTETVYGLAGNTFLPETIRRIFAVKGRPQDNPLIVHLYDESQLDQVVSRIPREFYPLYQAFCPGPLTMIMSKSENLPAEVSAGLDTVGVRFPNQRTARNLIRYAQVPLVAPSGNLSGRPSPTQARHMLDDLDGKIEYILDDGPCELGVESTVLDLTSHPPQILRPGVVTADLIYSRTGIKARSALTQTEKNAVAKSSPRESDLTVNKEPVPETANITNSSDSDEIPRSPGQKYRHYAPRAQVIIVRGDDRELPRSFLAQIRAATGQKIGFFGASETFAKLSALLQAEAGLETKEIIPYLYNGPEDIRKATHELFSALRALDTEGVDIIMTAAFPRETYGIAYMDRLERAAEVEEK